MVSPVQTVKQGVEKRTRIDRRALAVFRTLIAVIVVTDIALRSRNLGYFYTRDGVVSAELARGLNVGRSLLLSLPDSAVIVAAFFFFYLVSALFLLVGYRTRIAVVAVLLFNTSLNVRNPFVLSYADPLLSLLLFWSVFLPLGARWSVDALVKKNDERGEFLPQVTVGAASFFVLLQMVSMYVVNAFQKYREGGWTDGEVMLYLVRMSELTFLLGEYLVYLPDSVLRYAGIVWFYMLLASPLLLVLTGRLRSVFAAVFVLGHLSLLFSFRIGAFSLVSIAGVLLFFHPGFWDFVEERLVDSVSYGELTEGIRDEVEEVPPLREAVSGRTYKLATVTVVVVVLLSGVSMVYGNAKTAGQATGVLDAPEGPDTTLLDDDEDELVLLGTVQSVKEEFRLHQPDWTIMVNIPRIEHYYVFAGETEDGDTVDVYNERELSYDRPYEHLNRQYDTYRERFYMHNTLRSEAAMSMPRLFSAEMADHLCNGTGPDGSEIRRVSLYVGHERLTLDDTDGERNVVSLYHHTCDASEPLEVFAEPPPEFSAFDGGYEPLPDSFDTALEVPLSETDEIDDDLGFDGNATELGLDRCVERPSPFDAERLSRYTKEVEVDSRLAGGETVTGVGLRTTAKHEYTNGFAVQHRAFVHTEERPLRAPITYDVEYVVSDDFVFRRILPVGVTEISEEQMARNVGFTQCFGSG